jgi:hypothetical protein
LTVGNIVTTFLAFGTMIGALWLMTRPLRRTSKGFEQFLEDWHGVPERPGFDAIPGVPERLRKLERDAQALGEMVRKIDHELHPNSGGSMRDQVDKVRADVDAFRQRLGAIDRVTNDVAALTRAMGNPRTLQALARRIDVDDVPEQRTEAG